MYETIIFFLLLTASGPGRDPEDRESMGEPREKHIKMEQTANGNNDDEEGDLMVDVGNEDEPPRQSVTNNGDHPETNGAGGKQL